MASTAPSSTADLPGKSLPLAGVRVVEFTHMVMGPTCGMGLMLNWLTLEVSSCAWLRCF